MIKRLILLLLFSLSFGSFAQKKVRVIDNKGTVTYVDPSKWFQVAGNLYNKNGNGNVAIGLDTLTSPTARLVINNGGSTTLPALKLEYPFSGAVTDSILTWNSVDSTVRKRPVGLVVSEPWFSTATGIGATRNIDDVYIMGKAMVGANTPATVSGAGAFAKFTVTGGDASINTLTVGKGGGQQPTNTTIGYQALYGNNNFLSSNNLAIGYQAMYSNIGGSLNTAIGSKSMYNNGGGVRNSAMGFQSLTANVSGSDNTAIGYLALSTNNSVNSVAVGSEVLRNATGQGNTALGYKAGSKQSTGDYNIVIGYNKELPSLTNSNQLNIGNTIFGTGTNTALVGAGNIGIGTTTPSTKLEVDSGNPNMSGLRFSQLTSISPFTVGAKAIGVNATGDVVTTDVSLAANAWNRNGNNINASPTDFLGTTSADDLVVKTNNVENMRVLASNGNVGIGTISPATKLDVYGTTNASNYTSPVQSFSGSVVTWDMDGGSNAKWTLVGGSNTLTLSNMKAGMYGSIVVTNTGTSTIAFSGGTNKVINGGGGVPTLTQLAGTVDILTFFYDGTTFWWTVGNNYN